MPRPDSLDVHDTGSRFELLDPGEPTGSPLARSYRYTPVAGGEAMQYQLRFLECTRAFLADREVVEFLPSLTCPGYEDQTAQFTLGNRILPFSSTPSRMAACSVARRGVYTISPSYRRETEDDRHAQAFYALGVELPGLDLSETITFACDYVRHLFEQFGMDVPEFRHFRPAADLSDYEDYVKVWEQDHAEPAILLYPRHSPIRPYVNRTVTEGVECGFDLVLPDIGEIVSGGERNTDYLSQLGYDLPVPVLPSSGFGFGVERFLAFTLGLDSIDSLGGVEVRR